MLETKRQPSVRSILSRTTTVESSADFTGEVHALPNRGKYYLTYIVVSPEKSEQVIFRIPVDKEEHDNIRDNIRIWIDLSKPRCIVYETVKNRKKRAFTM